MASVDQVITVSFVLALSATSTSFRIRRAGVAGYDDPFGLTNTYNDMDRPRRADYRNYLRKQAIEDDESFFNPNSIPVEYVRDQPYEAPDENYGYIPEYMFEKSFQSYTPMDEYPLPYSGFNEQGYAPQKRTVHRSVPTIDELKTLFGEADVPMKRLPPVKRQEPILQQHRQHEDSTETTELSSTDSKADAVRKLIVAAEKLSVNGKPVEQRVEEEIVKHVDGDDSKLVDIFKEATINGDGDVKESQTETNLSEDDNNILDNSHVSDTPAQSKSKRASNNVITSDYVQDILNEITALKQKVSKLEVIQLLEEKENDYLANALKFATLDQLEDQDVFVEEEYDDINKATETESLLQQLTEGEEQVINDDDYDGDDEEALVEEMEDAGPLIQQELLESEMKRSPQVSAVSGEWLENPVRENVGMGALIEDDIVDEEDIDESPVDIPFLEDDLDDEDDEEDEVGEEAVAVLEAEIEREDEEKHVLAELLNSLSPSTVENIIMDLQTRSGARNELQDVCAPVLDLSKHCAFADATGIRLDDGDRKLCVRHQICYACGSGIGLSRSTCDEGYGGTQTAACEGDGECLREALFFLKLMKRFHDYQEYSPLECKNACVQDFIFGVD